MLRDLVDRQAIVDTAVRWAQALDSKDWVAARSCFADEIETDYTGLRGTGPTREDRRGCADAGRALGGWGGPFRGPSRH